MCVFCICISALFLHDELDPQSRIEIEYYSVAYFERITEFDALYIALSARLGRGSYTLHGRIRYSCVYIACMSPTLSGSSALQHVKLGDALEIRNRIIFDFYSGLPRHVLLQFNTYRIVQVVGIVKPHERMAEKLRHSLQSGSLYIVL